MAVTERELGELGARVRTLEEEVRLIRNRVHTLGNQFAEVQAVEHMLEELASVFDRNRPVVSTLTANAPPPDHQNWPITLRHVLIFSGGIGATVALLKLLGMLQ